MSLLSNLRKFWFQKNHTAIHATLHNPSPADHTAIHATLHNPSPAEKAIMSTFVWHQSSDAIKKWKPTGLGQQQHITEAIVTFVAENLQSLSIVESKAFSKILAIAEPRYQMPFRKYLSNILLSNRHDKIRTDIICKLSKVTDLPYNGYMVQSPDAFFRRSHSSLYK